MHFSRSRCISSRCHSTPETTAQHSTAPCLVLPAGDLAGRLAVVPMSQEAKGLDAGPRLAEKLVGCGDNQSAAIVSRIAAEEKAHVAVGKLLCACTEVSICNSSYRLWQLVFIYEACSFESEAWLMHSCDKASMTLCRCCFATQRHVLCHVVKQCITY